MEAPQFDRDLALPELLRALPKARLKTALTAALGPHWQIVDAGGKAVLGLDALPAAEAVAVPLRLDFEVIGRLVAAGVPGEQMAAAAAWLDMLLQGAYRYRMASDLHFEAVHADYAALQHEHEALQESETRYRELAAQLERRVEQQVEAITRTQRQLYQSEKMASVGSLAAGMAHEINNPIGFIRSNAGTAAIYVEKMRAVLQAFHRGAAGEAQELWRKTGLDFVLEDFPGLLAESISGADRVARIVTNLKKYASIDYAVSAVVDLNDAVRTVAGIIGDQMRDELVLELDLQPLPQIECDQGRINQMLLSIMQNAVQAIPDKGLIRVATRLDQREIRIAIRDSGCGMAPELLNRVFDPFFTTREVGTGTGLGLTVSADVAAAHGGRIEVESRSGAGSTFTVCLPVADGSKTAAP